MVWFYLLFCYSLQQLESQMKLKADQVSELGSQATHLKRLDPNKGAEIEARKAAVAERSVTFFCFSKMDEIFYKASLFRL